MKRLTLTWALSATVLFAQTQTQPLRNNWFGSTITGQFTLISTQNALQLAQAQTGQGTQGAQQVAQGRFGAEAIMAGSLLTTDDVRVGGLPRSLTFDVPDREGGLRTSRFSGRLSLLPRTTLLNATPISPTSTSFGFMGMTHSDQRNANNGNQFNVEPPSEGLAVANGYVVEGVNNAFQVYNTSGQPLLPAAISTNQLFGLLPALNRITGARGAYPTDIRIFYDQTLNRFFVLQRVQDNDVFGNLLASSHLYVAVSQSGDPTGTYNVYGMNTTNSTSPNGFTNYACPCVADYPQIGADQNGIYISWNDYNAYNGGARPVETIILAIDKVSLGQNSSSPTAVQFTVEGSSAGGYESTIRPAITPPGANYFAGNNGVEYFVSSQQSYFPGNGVGLWAVINTGSLATANPSLELLLTTVPTLAYNLTNPVAQRPGTIPLGSSLAPDWNIWMAVTHVFWPLNTWPRGCMWRFQLSFRMTLETMLSASCMKSCLRVTVDRSTPRSLTRDTCMSTPSPCCGRRSPSIRKATERWSLRWWAPTTIPAPLLYLSRD